MGDQHVPEECQYGNMTLGCDGQVCTPGTGTEFPCRLQSDNISDDAVWGPTPMSSAPVTGNRGVPKPALVVGEPTVAVQKTGRIKDMRDMGLGDGLTFLRMAITSQTPRT